jgi:hypothetical protein
MVGRGFLRLKSKNPATFPYRIGRGVNLLRQPGQGAGWRAIAV